MTRVVQYQRNGGQWDDAKRYGNLEIELSRWPAPGPGTYRFRQRVFDAEGRPSTTWCYSNTVEVLPRPEGTWTIIDLPTGTDCPARDTENAYAIGQEVISQDGRVFERVADPWTVDVPATADAEGVDGVLFNEVALHTVGTMNWRPRTGATQTTSRYQIPTAMLDSSVSTVGYLESVVLFNQTWRLLLSTTATGTHGTRADFVSAIERDMTVVVYHESTESAQQSRTPRMTPNLT